MRASLRLALLATASAIATSAPLARAGWPPDPSADTQALSDPSNWPNDPSYGIHSPTDNGQWALWSWIPPAAAMLPGFRTPELALGAGNHVDQAWQVTIGDPRVLIAVIDSGIQWDESDLILKAALNPGELPPPQDASGNALAYDADGDGAVTVADYANDARIPCGTSLPHPFRGCSDAAGTHNDPNHNGVFDAEDLILTFSDGLDDDHNGYVDDISGWDFFKDDNDPYDDTRYGHGSGEARDSSAETNNGIGSAGVCPRCLFVPLRAGDSFIADANDFAQAVVYATDLSYGGNTVHVVQEALGTLDNTRFTQQAIDYAYAHGLVVIASAADENSRHHNMPGTNNHTVYTHANTFNANRAQSSTSFLAYNNCTNYGGQLQMSVAAASCSSQAVGLLSGIAGLVHSEGLAAHLDPPLSAEEVRQLLIETVDDIDIPESQPTNPNYNPELYPSGPGWDQRFGYGRANAGRAVAFVRDGRIPPEVDITAPRWFETYFADRTSMRMISLEGRIAARRAPRFDYTIEWQPGIEPAEGVWRTLRHEVNVTAPVTGMLAQLDASQLTIDNPGEIENRHTITFRIRVTAHYDNGAGDVLGEARRVAYIVRDPDLAAGFPVDTIASVESSPHTVDLDNDGRREIVVASSDGLVHAIEPDGTELRGFPIHTNPDLGFDPTRTPSYRGSAAYSGASPAIDPDHIYEAVLSTPGIADIDNDHMPEIVVLGYHGTVYVFRADGSAYGHGFPRVLPAVPSSATDPDHILDRNVFGPPVLVDLNHDGTREIVFGAGDGNVYAIDPLTAGDAPGFPVAIHFPDPPGTSPPTQHNRAFGAVGVGHIDHDDIPDIVAVSNETLSGDQNSGAVYVVHGDGNLHAGGPYHPNWPIALTSLYFFPVVGSGIPSAPPIADLDGDGLDDIGLSGTANPVMVMAHGIQPSHPPRPDPNRDLDSLGTLASNERGMFSNARGATSAFINAFAMATFADLNGDGSPEFIISGASLSLGINLLGGGTRTPFEHLVGAWDVRNHGHAVPGFPQVIEDYTFFMNSAAADVSGDGWPEVIIGTGGYYLHAVDACGREAPGFPKFTGQWIIASPTAADLDGDHQLEVTTATRSGYVYAWHTRGRVDPSVGSIQWPTFRHDNANTGNYGSALDYGSRTSTQGTLTCPVANASDAGVHDAAPDAGAPRVSGDCGCRAPVGDESRNRGCEIVIATLALIASVVRRSRRRRR